MDLRNIFLVGMMGAGKTTLGRQLARRLARPFVDVDHEIEARTGVTISTIFEYEGEAGFRKREQQVLRTIAEQPGQVVATGGGAVMLAANRQLLKASGWVIYLYVSPVHLWQRTRRDSKRPLLQVDNPLEKLIELCAVRDPLYRDTAHLVVSPHHNGVAAQVIYLAAELETLSASEGAPAPQTPG